MQVGVFAPNVPATYEAHFGVPIAGAVLCILSTQFGADMLSEKLQQTAAKLLFVDCKFLPVARAALDILSGHASSNNLPLLVLIEDEDTSEEYE